jgi:hypothetical protein
MDTWLTYGPVGQLQAGLRCRCRASRTRLGTPRLLPLPAPLAAPCAACLLPAPPSCPRPHYLTLILPQLRLGSALAQPKGLLLGSCRRQERPAVLRRRLVVCRRHVLWRNLHGQLCGWVRLQCHALLRARCFEDSHAFQCGCCIRPTHYLPTRLSRQVAVAQLGQSCCRAPHQRDSTSPLHARELQPRTSAAGLHALCSRLSPLPLDAAQVP